MMKSQKTRDKGRLGAHRPRQSEKDFLIAAIGASGDRTHKIFAKKAAARQLLTFSLNRHADPPEHEMVRAPSR
jgi:hypothetical protein